MQLSMLGKTTLAQVIWSGSAVGTPTLSLAVKDQGWWWGTSSKRDGRGARVASGSLLVLKPAQSSSKLPLISSWSWSSMY